MSHGPEHQIEQAEHAIHASHDNFNKNVTMSIAIVAAVLACVTMLGHRSHNETLRLQGEALSLQSRASIKSTETANAWAYYQSKNMFYLESAIVVDMLSVVPYREGKKAEFDALVEAYEGDVAHYSGDKNSRPRKNEKKGKLAKAKADAEDLEEKMKKLLTEADAKIEDSHKEHLKAARLDYGELALQFAVVLCSLAILTKNRSFWFVGIASGALGAVVAVSAEVGMFMGHH
jgi:hypothetical protein